MLRRLMICLMPFTLAACGDFLTDGATRVAYDLEHAIQKVPGEEHGRLVLQHVPKASPEGCDSDYKIQLSENSLIGIWCIDARSGKVTGSHTTTYHLNFVKVPRTWILDKRAGVATTITLERQGGDIVVVDVQ